MNRVVIVGAMNMDLAVSTANLPRKGESVIASTILQSPGGKGANQAVAAALVGGTVSLISMRGNDAYGESLIESAEKTGVATDLVLVDASEKTGTAVVAVDSHGDNMILISPGANALLTAPMAEQQLRAARDVSVVSVCGEMALPTIRQALKTSKEIGALSVLNLSPYNPEALDCLATTSVLVVNQHEAADITGVAVVQDDWAATAKAFATRGSTTVVVTLGADGAMILDCTSADGSPIKVDSIKVDAVDTTGCGDAFTGSMCVELASGKPIAEAVRFAVKAAGFAAKKMGAQISYGTREQVLT